MSPTTDILTQLHEHYIEAVNIAVADGNEARAHQLAAEFDREALEAIRRQLAAA